MDRDGPRVLYTDIETAPSLGYYFDLWKENNIVRTTKNWFILSVAWKWEHEKTYKVKALCDYKGYTKDKTNDELLVKDLWKLLDKADIIIGHNHNRFDLRKIRSRLLKHHLKPPSPFKTIDTLQVMRRYFAEDSNRLDSVSQAHGLGRKLPHQGFKLWEDCIEGSASAWRTMKRYNIQDVRLTVSLYKLVRPWIENHHNFRLFDGKNGCPVCASSDIIGRGIDRRKSGNFQRWKCKKCGKWFIGDKIKTI